MPNLQALIAGCVFGLAQQLDGRHGCERADLVLWQKRAQVADLHVQPRNALRDLVPRGAVPIEGEARALGRRADVPPYDQIRFARRRLELDLDVARVCADLDKAREFCRAPQNFGRPVQPEADRARNARFARPVRSQNHIQIGTRAEFDRVVGDEVAQLDAHDGAGDESAAKYSRKVSEIGKKKRAYPSTSRGRVLTRF